MTDGFLSVDPSLMETITKGQFNTVRFRFIEQSIYYIIFYQIILYYLRFY